MINANELRIGNWIFINNGEKPKYPYQITAHDIEEIDGNGTDCFPIELSPELLVKIGFKNIHENYWMLENELLLNFDAGWWWTNA